MKSIDSYNKEALLEDNLSWAYKEWGKRMIRAVSSLPPEVINRHSNPFLVKLLPHYRKSKRNVENFPFHQ